MMLQMYQIWYIWYILKCGHSATATATLCFVMEWPAAYVMEEIITHWSIQMMHAT